MLRVALRIALLVALTVVAATLAVEAQQAGKVYRIGYLTPFPLPHSSEEAFRKGLADLGYVEGRDVVIEARSAEQKYGELQRLAAELVALNVDVIVTATGTTALAAKRVTSTVPIVMAASNDAVSMGIVESLQRPGGNVTGVTGLSAELAPKRLEIVKTLLPRLTTVAVLWCPRAPINRVELDHVHRAATALGVRVSPIAYNEEPLSWRDSMDNAFRQERPDALFLLDCTSIPHLATVEYASQRRLPLMSHDARLTQRGGLVSYGPDWLAMARRRAPAFVDRILKGAKPTDLPVEQPAEFQLAINLKTAKVIGLMIPPSFMFRVNVIIE